MGRPQRQCSRRLFTPEASAPEKPLTKAEKRKIINDRYRRNLKADPERYAQHKAYDKEWQRQYRLALSGDKKAAQREKTRLRNIAYRQRQKEKGLQDNTLKPSTRLDAKKLQERRERNKLSQQKRRSNMSAQKKRREREANLAYYHRTKARTPQAIPGTSSSYSSSLNASLSLSSSASPTKRVPHRSTIYRLRKRLGNTLLVSLKGLVKSIHKKDKNSLASVGVSYQSPSKAPPPQKLPSPLLKKRDIHTTIVKRLLRNQNTKGLYQKKRKFASLIKDYYINKANFLPGKSGVTQSLQVKKALDKSVGKLHEEFVETHGPLVSRATFFRHRPKNVLSFTKIPFQQCLCEVCMNPMLKVKTLNSVGWPKVQTLKELINLTVCEGDKKECLDRLCVTCGVHCVDDALRSVNDKMSESVSWQKWERVRRNNGFRIDLVQKKGDLSELVVELKTELLRLPVHDFVHRWQSKQFSTLVSNVPSTWAVLVLDFAENYLCVQQDQPQSAYFSYSQVTVHPCVLYYRCSCGSRITDNWTFVSDVLQHSADMVHCITMRILSHLESIGVSKVVVYSDGCSSQYKSRLPFSYLQSYDSSRVRVHRCYFGARHGKNPCDALGGLLKQAATRSVRARKATIQNANDLFMFASRNLSVLPSTSPDFCSHMRRAYFLLQAQDISDESLPCQTDRPLSGTRQLHDIMSTKEGLLVRNLSCFCPPCCAGDFSSCHNADHVDAWRLCKQFLPARNIGSSLSSVEDECVVVSAAPDIDISEMNACELPVQVVHSRESFFVEIQAIFCACTSFHELHVAVREVSSSLSDFPLPKYHHHTISSIGGTIDTVALNHFSSMGIDHVFPVETIADGNCVPRTLSFHCFGNQDNHVEVRCRIVHEMVSNALDYLCLSSDEIAFLFGHSDYPSDSPESVFRLEALNMSKNSVYMGMWQLMAAANALRVNILSVYPHLGPKQYHSFFNRSLKAKEPSSNHAFAIFWSSTALHENEMPSEYWTANHVVPLMPKNVPTEINIELID